jgi:hypothetical protein
VSAAVEAFFSACLAAGFEISTEGGPHRIGGQDTGNRFAWYQGRLELLCGYTGRILNERFDKFTLAEYREYRAKGGGGADLQGPQALRVLGLEVRSAAGDVPVSGRTARVEVLEDRSAEADAPVLTDVPHLQLACGSQWPHAWKVDHPMAPRPSKPRSLFS